MEKILLVEDDPNLSMMIVENLEDLDFEVQHLSNGEEVLPLLEQEVFDLILMDVDLGGEKDGFDIAEEIRITKKTLPIIFATAKKGIPDLERGFNMGYMDYLKKPFGVKELSLRINALLRRDDVKNEGYKLGLLTFDPSNQSLTVKEKTIRLTRLESTFLTLLCENKGKVVTKEDLIKVLWEQDDDPQGKESSLHNLAYKLRKMLEKDPAIVLKTISKNGYSISISETGLRK